MDEEEEFKPPFDPAFAEDAVRKAADRCLPPAHMGLEVETIWTQCWDHGDRIAKGLTIRLIRDLSRIDVDLDFGNIPFDGNDAEKALRLAMTNFEAAAASVIEERRNLTIHATSAALIATYRAEDGSTGWKSVRDHLGYPVSRRCAATITPRGWNHRKNDEKLRWRGADRPHEEFRLPGKRILIPEFRLGDVGRMTNDRLRVNRRIPETVLTSKRNGPLHQLVSIPGFDEVEAIITGHVLSRESTELSIRSPTIDMEEAFELMARVMTSAGINTDTGS